MYQLFLSSTFSPMMLKENHDAVIEELTREEVLALLRTRAFVSVVGHENTARLLTRLLGVEVLFNRQTIEIGDHDQLLCCIPTFRVDIAREFTDDEIKASTWRYFIVSVEDMA